ncbi:MAG: hypothetical protein R3B53_03740 [Candidatus Paceibacterota bacterium]
MKPIVPTGSTTPPRSLTRFQLDIVRRIDFGLKVLSVSTMIADIESAAMTLSWMGVDLTNKVGGQATLSPSSVVASATWPFGQVVLNVGVKESFPPPPPQPATITRVTDKASHLVLIMILPLKTLRNLVAILVDYNHPDMFFDHIFFYYA